MALQEYDIKGKDLANFNAHNKAGAYKPRNRAGKELLLITKTNLQGVGDSHAERFDLQSLMASQARKVGWAIETGEFAFAISFTMTYGSGTVDEVSVTL